MQPDAYTEMAAVEEHHWWFRGRRKVLRNALSSLRKPRDCRILEIGAGTGGNLDLLRTFGSVTAVERELAAREIAHRKRGVGFLEGSLPASLPTFDRPFDVVCMFDVLEHIDDDVTSLRTVGGLLAPGGVVVLTVPAAPSLWSQHDEVLHHKRRYTQASLLAAIREAGGFRVDRMTHFNSVLFPVAWIVRKLRKNSPDGTGRPPEPLNTLLYATFALETEWVKRRDLPFGLSLLAVLSQGSP